MEWWKEPFFQVALPIMITFVIATWYQGKRIDDLRDSLNKRIDDLEKTINQRLLAIEARLVKIENLLTEHDKRITRVEERTALIR
jgi:hypothetical protein